VIVEDGVAKLPDRSSFVGSLATMDVCLRTAVRYGVPVTDAVRSVSLTPAELVGKAARKGSLTPGKDADVVLADDALNVTAVYLRGKKRCAR
jgi:N-acetylglucosamine-6-phosphate deacetylase